MIKTTSILVLILVLLPLLAQAATETRHFRGEMEIVRISGASCGVKIKQGDRVPIDLAVKLTDEKVDGYITVEKNTSGLKFLTGHFAGNSPGEMPIAYLGEAVSSKLTDLITLNLNGNNPSGEMREKSLASSEPGCNIALSRLLLSTASTGVAADNVYGRLAKLFRAEYENKRALDLYDVGKIQEAISHFEAEIKLREVVNGYSSAELIDPLLVLSVAYCSLERCDKGKELLNRVFAIPMDPLKQKIWRETVLPKLFEAQAMRLVRKESADKAFLLLRNVVAVNPELTMLYRYMAEVMDEWDKAEEACTLIGNAWVGHRDDTQLIDAQAQCLTWKGNQEVDSENLDSAIVYYKLARKLTPDELELISYLSGAYVAKGAADAALSLFKDNAGMIIKKLGQKDYELSLGVLYEAIGDRAAKTKDYAAAESSFRNALELNPTNPTYSTKLAGIMHKSGRFDKAIQLLEASLQKCPDNSCREQTAKAIEHEKQIEFIIKKIGI